MMHAGTPAGRALRAVGAAAVASCLALATLPAWPGPGAWAQTSGNDADAGPPVINPKFGARMPRKCNAVTHLPNLAEAAALSQCFMESGGEPGAFRPMIYLWQNLQVQMGKSRPYAYNADSHNTSIDTEAPVYPIRVTGDQLSCTGAATCPARHADKAEGVCFKTTFGDWQCHFSQVFGVVDTGTALPVPTTY